MSLTKSNWMSNNHWQLFSLKIILILCGNAFFGQVGQHWGMDKWSRHCLEEGVGPAWCCYVNSCQHVDNFRQYLCCHWLLPSHRVGCLHVPSSPCGNKSLVGTAVHLRLSLSMTMPDCRHCQWQLTLSMRWYRIQHWCEHCLTESMSLTLAK